jgi:hypothetical protein
MRDIPEEFILAKFQEPHGSFRSDPLLVVDDKTLGLTSVHFEDTTPIGGGLVEQHIEKKNGIHVPNLAGYCLVTEVAPDDSELRELPCTIVNDIRWVDVNDGTHGSIILIKGVERVAALDSPHPTQVSE